MKFTKKTLLVLTLLTIGVFSMGAVGMQGIQQLTIESFSGKTVATNALLIKNSSGTTTTTITAAGAATFAGLLTCNSIAPAVGYALLDDINLTFGTGLDWAVQYDEGVDDQLLFLTANTSAVAITDPMVEFIVGATPTANQQVFGLSKGTQASNTPLFTVDEDGDAAIAGTATITGAATLSSTLSVAGQATLTGGAIIADDQDLTFGHGTDWKIQYDEGVDDQLIAITAGTAAGATTDPMFEILTGASMTSNQECFGVAKGTQASNTSLFTVDEDGDGMFAGGLTVATPNTDHREMISLGEMDFFKQGTSWEITFSTTKPNRRMQGLIGANTTEVIIPIKLPARTTASKGAMLNSVEIYYTLPAIDPTALTAVLYKTTNNANTSEITVATVTTSYDTYHNTAGNRYLTGAHTVVLTVTTPAYAADEEGYYVVLAMTGAVSGSIDVYPACANFSYSAH